MIVVSAIVGSALMTGGLLVAWCLGATLFLGGALAIIGTFIRLLVGK